VRLFQRRREKKSHLFVFRGFLPEAPAKPASLYLPAFDVKDGVGRTRGTRLAQWGFIRRKTYFEGKLGRFSDIFPLRETFTKY
jgi:hypothetical protein